MIAIKNLHKKYGKLHVLKGVDLDIENSGIIAVLGPNGSGKTTLIKSILGMVLPSKGDIFFDGKSIKNQWTYRNDIGYLPQIANFPNNLTVIELLRMMQDIKQRTSDPQPLIEMFRLQPHLHKKLGNLSGGTKQKVNIVITFMVDTPYLILDEPTSGLDPVSLLCLKELILNEKQKGKTILITSHILSLVEELSDTIIFLLEGNIFFKGTTAELLKKTQQTNFEQAIACLLTKEKNV